MALVVLNEREREDIANLLSARTYICGRNTCKGCKNGKGCELLLKLDHYGRA